MKKPRLAFAALSVIWSIVSHYTFSVILSNAKNDGEGNVCKTEILHVDRDARLALDHENLHHNHVRRSILSGRM